MIVRTHEHQMEYHTLKDDIKFRFMNVRKIIMKLETEYSMTLMSQNILRMFPVPGRNPHGQNPQCNYRD